MRLFILLLLVSCCAGAVNETALVIIPSGFGNEAAPARFAAAWSALARERTEDRAERTRERAEDRAERMREGAEFALRLTRIERILGDVAAAVVTTAVAQSVEKCSHSSALFLQVCRPPSPVCSHCSTVPLFAIPGEFPRNTSTYFLTSAHCLPATDAVLDIMIVTPGGGLMVSCSLVAFFNESGRPIDLALLHCSSGLPVPPTMLSTQPYLLHQPVALLGYSFGEHTDPGLVYAGDRALHIRFSHLAVSLQHPQATNASQLTSGGVNAPREYALFPTPSSKGFVDITPESGMSGGAVVDMACGLWGITERKSSFGMGGAFVRLTDSLVTLVLAAVNQHGGI